MKRADFVIIPLLAAGAGIAEVALLVMVVSTALLVGSGDASTVINLPLLPQVKLGLPFLLGGAVGLALIRLAVQLLLQVRVARATSRAVSHLEEEAYSAFLRTSWPEQIADRDGQLLQLTTVNVARAGQSIQAVCHAMVAASSFVILVFAAVTLDVRSVAALLGAVGLLFLILRPLTSAVRRQGERAALANLDFAQNISETVSLSQEIRVLAVTDEAKARSDSFRDRVVDPYYRSRLLIQIQPAFYQAGAFFLIVGFLGLGAALGGQGATLAATVLIFFRALQQSNAFQSQYQALNEALPSLVQYQASIRRYAAAEPAGGGAVVNRIERVRLEGVGFKYPERPPTLVDVTAEIVEGQMVGIVGPSGSGKSTLLQILLRLREPTSGAMLVNDIPARDVSLDSWFARTAVVPQEARLFSGTIRDNIRFFRPCSDAAITAAAEQAHILEDALGWPKGLDTQVGERSGAAMSGGQRQRIALARALVGAPDLLVLDEPTSALDARSETLVQQTLLDLRGQMTIVVVTHRPGLLDACDEVWNVKDGAVAVSQPTGGESLHLPG